MRVGGLDLSMSFDAPAQTAIVQGGRFALADGTNVVLVDGVDSKSPVVSKLSVPPSLADGSRVDDLVRRSPRLQAFLRCDEAIPDVRLQPFVDRVCAEMRGNK
jgi:hypothetical protein